MAEPVKPVDLEQRIQELERSQRMLWALEQASVAMSDALTLDDVLESIGTTLMRLNVHSIVFRLDPDGERMRLAYLSSDSAIVRMLERRIGLTREKFSVEVGRVDFYKRLIHERETEYLENSYEVARQVLPGIAGHLVSFILERLGMAQMIGAPLVTGGEVWGIFIISSNLLTADDKSAMQVFVQQVGSTLHKIKLMEQLQHTLERFNESQAQLLQAQKMEALGRFTGGIAHDLNNLLTGILMGQELAMMHLSEDSPARAELDLIGDTTHRAAELIQKLLAFSRAQMLQRSQVRLREVVEGLAPLLHRVIGEDLQLKLDLEKPKREQLVRADVSQIEQVVMNLAVNARDAMPTGGGLTIRTRSLVVDAELASAHKLPPEAQGRATVRLSVSDTGPGIEEDVLAQIFDPFFTTKDQSRGTGLGLSVAYGILAQHEGWLTVETELGRGTTFHAWLPADADSASEPGEVAERAARPQLPSLSGRRVLVVEDEPALRELAVRGLSRHGISVCIARTIDEARGLLAADPCDVVVSDLVLPDGSGAEFCEEAQSAWPGVQIVLMSGYSDDRVSHDIIEAHDWSFVRKPFSSSELAAAIAAALG